MIVHSNLVGLSILYHNLIDRDPKIVWSETVADTLPGGKLRRPVKLDWEPDYMFTNDNFFPADIKKIFAPNQDKF